MSVLKNCSLHLLLEYIKIIITFIKLYNPYRCPKHLVIIPFFLSFFFSYTEIFYSIGKYE